MSTSEVVDKIIPKLIVNFFVENYTKVTFSRGILRILSCVDSVVTGFDPNCCICDKILHYIIHNLKIISVRKYLDPMTTNVL